MRSKTKVIKSIDDATKELDKLNDRMAAPHNVRVGLPKDSNAYPDGTSVILVGTVQEFGSEKKGIPSRSFLRKTIAIKRREYKQLFVKLSKAMVKGDADMTKALGTIGLSVQADVQRRISAGIPPKLKSREGTPLIDTGHLRRSITFEIT